jgi:hypothetical protein
VPRISFFFGIVIRMYWDEADHQMPHYHAEYGEYMASIAFDGKILGGSLPHGRCDLFASGRSCTRRS